MQMAASDAYERKKAAEAERQRKKSAAGRDIGEIPPIADPARRESCWLSLRAFCETYLPTQFPLAWSPSHLRALTKLEDCILRGGQFAFAMPRGSGKTTLARAAVLWAALYGHHRYGVLVSATERASKQLLRSIKQVLQTNDLLVADFPEACYPITALEGITQRASGQLYRGEATGLKWAEQTIQFARIPGAPCCEAQIDTVGITGAIRGKQFTRGDGEIVRPSLVLIDDPQTKQSARSFDQNNLREEIILQDVLGLAGPGKQISALMTVTVIEIDDLAERFLSHERRPEWQGERTGIVDGWPKREDLWHQYAELLSSDLADGGDGAKATSFYVLNRKAMDLGATATWPQRHGPSEASALEHAMRLYFRDPQAFAAEYQNAPKPKTTNILIVSREVMRTRLSGLDEHELGDSTELLTGFIDVHLAALYWVVCGWSSDFSGGPIAYGTWPEQGLRYFSLSSLTRTILASFPDLTETAAIAAALNTLGGQLLDRTWTRSDGVDLSIDLCMVDAGWGDHTETVFNVCRQKKWAQRLRPSKGFGIGPDKKPMSEWRLEAGDKKGDHWILAKAEKYRSLQQVTFDSNFWKSRIHRGLATEPGQPGAITLWGDDARNHDLIIDHLQAEYAFEMEARGRRLTVFRPRPDKPDNHWLDGLVGAAVAASVRGLRRLIAAPGSDSAPDQSTQPKAAKRRRVRYM